MIIETRNSIMDLRIRKVIEDIKKLLESNSDMKYSDDGIILQALEYRYSRLKDGK